MAGKSRPFVGVDLNGGVHAGLHSWAAAGHLVEGGLVVEHVQPLVELTRGDPARDAVFPALAQWLGHQHGAVVAIDAPFGLPAEAVAEGDWLSFVRAFPSRFPDLDAFATLRRRAGPRVAAVRATDRVRGLNTRPYAPPRSFLTWFYLRHVLSPLVAASDAVAAPMQPSEGRVPVLVETSVRAALRARCIAAPFRGLQDLAVQSRRAVLARLGATDQLGFASEAVAAVATDHELVEPVGAVVAAAVAGRLARNPALLYTGIPDAARIEGHVYV